jgi:hypothetical protein
MDSLANPGAPQLDLPGERSRPGATTHLSIHCYLPVAAWYFFLNHAGLPNGLFYSTIFSPLLFVWLYLHGRRWLTAKFLLFLSPFILAHMILGIGSPLYYLRSLFLLWTAYVTTYALSWALLKCRGIERLFDELILLNFFAALIALAAVPTPLRDLLWHDDSDMLVTTSHQFRLSLLTTEPSVYAELMLPLLIFAALRLLRESNGRNLFYLIMIGFPLLLSQSFGGVSMGLAGIAISLVTSYRRLLMRSRTFITAVGLVIAVGALLVTHNPISERVMQVATGSDSSTHSRTLFSFIVAYSVAATKSLWWGAGLGQAKLVNVSGLGIGFDVGIIPNAVAGTFAELGIIGVLVRFAVELYLFFSTKVYRNSFRLAMFVVAFITQLTGSHLDDVQQYLMWCFAFLPFFPAMSLRGDSRQEVSPS